MFPHDLDDHSFFSIVLETPSEVQHFGSVQVFLVLCGEFIGFDVQVNQSGVKLGQVGHNVAVHPLVKLDFHVAKKVNLLDPSCDVGFLSLFKCEIRSPVYVKLNISRKVDDQLVRTSSTGIVLQHNIKLLVTLQLLVHSWRMKHHDEVSFVDLLKFAPLKCWFDVPSDSVIDIDVKNGWQYVLQRVICQLQARQEDLSEWFYEEGRPVRWLRSWDALGQLKNVVHCQDDSIIQGFEAKSVDPLVASKGLEVKSVVLVDIDEFFNLLQVDKLQQFQVKYLHAEISHGAVGLSLVGQPVSKVDFSRQTFIKHQLSLKNDLGMIELLPVSPLYLWWQVRKNVALFVSLGDKLVILAVVIDLHVYPSRRCVLVWDLHQNYEEVSLTN